MSNQGIQNDTTLEDIYEAECNTVRKCVEVIESQIRDLESQIGPIPNSSGGWFAKKFAANSLRGCIGLIRREYPDLLV